MPVGAEQLKDLWAESERLSTVEDATRFFASVQQLADAREISAENRRFLFQSAFRTLIVVSQDDALLAEQVIVLHLLPACLSTPVAAHDDLLFGERLRQTLH